MGKVNFRSGNYFRVLFFKHSNGLYEVGILEYNRIAFGLWNAPSSYFLGLESINTTITKTSTIRMNVKPLRANRRSVLAYPLFPGLKPVLEYANYLNKYCSEYE